MKALARRALPPATWDSLASIWHYLMLAYTEPAWRLDPRARQSCERLRALADRHAGERCFIIGNGPSLKQMDLSVLKSEYTFGLNRIYLLFEQMGFVPSFFVSVNRLVIQQCNAEIANVPATKFIAWHSRNNFPLADDIVFLRSLSRPHFSTNLAHGMWEGSTVTYVAMQIAYHLGFSQVVLIGVDHSFQTTGQPHTVVVSDGADPDHFAPDYFGQGFRWQLPDLERSERAYRLAKKRFEQDGKEIVDATVGGQLQVFRKVDFASLF